MSSTGSTPLPRLRLETASLEPHDRFDAWRDYLSNIWTVDPINEAGSTFPASANTHLVGNVIFNETVYGPQRMIRTRSDIRREPRQYVALRILNAGTKKSLVNGRDVGDGQNRIHIVDYMDEVHSVSTIVKQASVIFPYGLIDYDPSLCRLPESVERSSPTGRLIEAGVFGLINKMEGLSMSDADSIIAGIGGLLKGVLMHDRADQMDGVSWMDGTRRDAMLRYIDANLHRPELSIGDLCRVFRASRSTVYRVFRDDGGVRHVLNMRRLEKIYDELAAAEPKRGTISRTAERWGFFEAGDLNRRFRSRFSVSPSDILGADLAERSSSYPAIAHSERAGRPAVEAVGAWLRA